jgi:hypothetical protein
MALEVRRVATRRAPDLKDGRAGRKPVHEFVEERHQWRLQAIVIRLVVLRGGRLIRSQRHVNWIDGCLHAASIGRLLAVKHAGGDALDAIEPLLQELRALPWLREKTRGTFYRRSRAFLHFHEHGAELYADVRFDDEFERVPVTTRSEQGALLDRLRLMET